MKFYSEFDREELRRGCMLATIAHAIFTSGHPELAHEQSWDGDNYNVQDTQGSLGTVTFAPERTVGAFFNAHSSRNPLTSSSAYDPAALQADMPPEIRGVAERDTLQYLIQDYNGAEVPIVTTAFWSEGERLVSPEPWDDFFSNGGHLVRTQLNGTGPAIDVWRAEYSLSVRQAGLLQTLFSRKLNKSGPIVLDDQERAVLLENGAFGLQQCRELLAEIGITVP